MVLITVANAVSIVQIIALILLTVGVYPYNIRTKNRNLIIHGFLSLLALSVNLVTVILVMIPVFTTSLGLISKLSMAQSAVVLVHVVSGAFAIVFGFVIVFSWITQPLGELGCTKMWRLMLPVFLTWAFSVATGLTIHIFNIV